MAKRPGQGLLQQQLQVSRRKQVWRGGGVPKQHHKQQLWMPSRPQTKRQQQHQQQLQVRPRCALVHSLYWTGPCRLPQALQLLGAVRSTQSTSQG
jgi:hypothetical protein